MNGFILSGSSIKVHLQVHNVRCVYVWVGNFSISAITNFEGSSSGTIWYKYLLFYFSWCRRPTYNNFRQIMYFSCNFDFFCFFFGSEQHDSFYPLWPSSDPISFPLQSPLYKIKDKMSKFALKLHLNKPGLHSVEKPMIVPFHFLTFSVPFVTCKLQCQRGAFQCFNV